MQRLAQQVWLARRETLNTGATVGELAWEWGAGRAAQAGRTYRFMICSPEGRPVRHKRAPDRSRTPHRGA
jgi:hypothetical protein